MQKQHSYQATSSRASLIARALASSLVAFSLALNLPALSETPPYPLQGKVFDASFATKGPSLGKGTVRFASDGKGHLHVENSLLGEGVFAIVDLEKETMVTVNGEKKTYVDGTYTNANLLDEDTIKSSSTLIGEEQIDGHKCKKYKRTSGLSGTFWVGNDTHFMVHCDTSSGITESEYALKSWSPVEPSPNLFQMPNGCKEQER
jgi:hypothetical protein